MKMNSTVSIIGLSLALGLSLMLIAAQAAQSEYSNPAITDTNSAAYWLDQGGLLSTYGNYPAAIRAYEKALELEPSNNEALFNLGVANAEVGDYQKAIALIDKALVLSADNGRYLYGRAWVLLLSGQRDKAHAEMQKAAALGNLDAIAYLQHQAGGQY